MNILKEIVAYKRGVIEDSKKKVSQEQLLQQLSGTLSSPRFRQELAGEGIHLIAEVKKASPSIGVIRDDFDPVAIAKAYVEGGATGLSVLTEDKYFKGELAFLKEIRRSVSVPLLRKDFIIDKYQLYESKLYGADAVLLIASLLEKEALRQFLQVSREIKLDVVVEVHDDKDLKKALECAVGIVGINTRNLADFSTDLNILPRLFKRMPAGCLVICESGIKDLGDLAIVKNSGVNGVLVGEALIKAKDPLLKTREFVDFLNK